ncbi:hypothetical protein EYV94_10715 [Puteibacter caeruleilacunae]|nr:hypothetical protein EYV94_10715 [Puteibacter caeruleilacunae]
MKPLKPIDYVFYTFAYIYGVKFGYFKEKEVMASNFLAILQTMNIYALCLFMWQPIPSFAKENALIVLPAILIASSFFNQIRYNNRRPYSELSETWGNDHKKDKIVKRIAVGVYFVLSHVIVSYAIIVS